MDFQAVKFVPNGLWNDQRWATIVFVSFHHRHANPWQHSVAAGGGCTTSKSATWSCNKRSRSEGRRVGGGVNRGSHREPLVRWTGPPVVVPGGNHILPSPAGSGSTWRQVFARVIFRLLFNLGSIFDHNHGTSRKDSRGTQEPKNSSRTTSLTARVAEPLPSLSPPLAGAFTGVWGPSCAFGIKYRKGSPGGRGWFTSRPLRRCLFPLFAVGVFATKGTLDRVGKHGVIVRDHSKQRGRRWTPACGGHCIPPICPVGMETVGRGDGPGWKGGRAGRREPVRRVKQSRSLAGRRRGQEEGSVWRDGEGGTALNWAVTLTWRAFRGLAWRVGSGVASQPSRHLARPLWMGRSRQVGGWFPEGGLALCCLLLGEIADTLGLELPDLMDCRAGGAVAIPTMSTNTDGSSIGTADVNMGSASVRLLACKVSCSSCLAPRFHSPSKDAATSLPGGPPPPYSMCSSSSSAAAATRHPTPTSPPVPRNIVPPSSLSWKRKCSATCRRWPSG